jgi:osomolarity two-component system sensor histidine kinase NIK1
MTDNVTIPDAGESVVSQQCWLVVEDDPINRRLAQITLTRLGYKVDVAVNGSAGVDMFSQNRYDHILMDIMMPVMGGIEATTRIRQIESERQVSTNHRVIIIAFTANAFEDDRSRCFAAGMDYYINKPLDIEELQRILNS